MAFLFQEDFNPEFPPRLGTLTRGGFPPNRIALGDAVGTPRP
jgi:hypothetical protein